LGRVVVRPTEETPEETCASVARGKRNPRDVSGRNKGGEEKKIEQTPRKTDSIGKKNPTRESFGSGSSA